MFQVIFIFLFGYAFIKVFSSPYWSAIVLMGYVLCEKTAFDYIPFNDNLLPILSIASALSFLYNKVGSQVGGSVKFDIILRILFFYIIYLSISSFSTFFFGDNRNWFWTYLQSFFLVFIISNSIKSYDELKQFMKWLLIFGFFSATTYIVKSGSLIFETEISNSNTYGRLFLILGIFSFAFFRDPNNTKFSKVIFFVLTLFFSFCILLTGSRTSLLIFLGLTLYFFMINRGFSVSNIFMLLIVLGSMILVIPEEFFENLLSTFDDSTYEGRSGDTEYNSIRKNVRLLMWEASLKMLNDTNWFFGIGVGNFKHYMPRYLPFLGLEASHPHNTYVSVLVESGIIGLTIFLYLITKSFMFYQSYRESISKKNIVFLEAWFLSFIVFLIGGLTKHDHYDKLLFLFLGISSVIYKLRKAI